MVIRKVLQSLIIGCGVVKPWAVQTAVEPELPVPQRQSPADGQHGIRVVLFHGEAAAVFRDIAQRVEVPQNLIRGQPQGLKVPEPTVGSQQKVILLHRLQQAVKPGSAENQKTTHGTPP